MLSLVFPVFLNPSDVAFNDVDIDILPLLSFTVRSLGAFAPPGTEIRWHIRDRLKARGESNAMECQSGMMVRTAGR